MVVRSISGIFFFSSRRRHTILQGDHTRLQGDWSSDVCSSDLFEILQNQQKPTIAICMGEPGLISRVLAKKFGAFLTFASLRDESATAPGQVTIHEMKQIGRASCRERAQRSEEAEP